MTTADPVAELAGPLAGLRVVEVASEHAAFAGKLIADLGADVVVVEPPGGHPSRDYGPVRRRRAGPRAQPLLVALQHVEARRRARPGGPRCEGAVPRSWSRAPTSCSRARHRAASPRSASTTTRCARTTRSSSGCRSRRSGATRRARRSRPPTSRCWPEPDPAWSCGYDDHTIPPVRGGGNQAFHTGSMFAVMAALTAVLAPRRVGSRAIRRREHARGLERHHGELELRVAGREEHGDPPDRSSRAHRPSPRRRRCAAPTGST